MILETQCAPPNSLVLVMGPDGKIPESTNRNLIAATSSCLAIGTRSEIDGDTTIILTDEPSFELSRKSGQIVYEGKIETPQGQLSIYTIAGEALLTIATRQPHTRIQIWANDEQEPNEIAILINRFELQHVVAR
jgi:hypothetical protein